MSNYGWLITRDHLDNVDIDVIGPRDIPTNLQNQLETGGGTPFRIYDDDGELYYSGRIVGDYDGFEPLDDYGTPNAGATEIMYQDPNTKKWTTL